MSGARLARLVGLALVALALGCAGTPEDEPVRPEETDAEAWERLYGSGDRWSRTNSDASALYHERAFQLAKRFGTTDPRHVRSETAFGEARRRQGRVEDAHRLLRSAAKHAHELDPPDPELLASVLQSLGLLEVMSGELEAAEAAFAESALLRIDQLDAHAPETAENIVQLAEAQRRLGKFDAAEENLVQAAEIYVGHGDEYAIRIATIQNNRGLLYQEMGRYADAEPLHRQAILSARQEANEHNPNTAIYTRGLGDLYVRLGELEKAEELYRYAYDVLEKTVGPENVETQIASRRLEAISARLGRPTAPDDETFR